MTATTCDDCGAVVGEDSCRTHRERETFWGGALLLHGDRRVRLHGVRLLAGGLKRGIGV